MTEAEHIHYEPLTEKTALELVHRLGLFEDARSLSCREIGDGNLNYVFRITEKDTSKGIIIKQALPYAKVIGESWPLTIKRAAIEANALVIFGSYCKEYVPKVYYSDEKLAITVMEDLSHLTIAREGLINGEEYPLLSKHIGEYIAKTLFYTSDYFLDHTKKKELARQFTNPELCHITETFVFTDPFFDSESNDYEAELNEEVQAIWQNNMLKLEVAKLKKSFLTEQEALLHGDLHTGSIFAGRQETKVIDPEFSFYGPIGFDLGQYMANLLFQAFSRSQESKEAIFTHLHDVWDSFAEVFTALWNAQGQEAFCRTEGYLEFVLNKITNDAFGFAGCELIRRTIGLSHVKDLDRIQDKDTRISAKKEALRIGEFLIKNRKQLDISLVTEAVSQHNLSLSYTAKL
ncbi:S-methyl-5-thioribose kinase [Bacillus sp. MUM 13]|uniref:S-methyl-5-thioribose kinase n=1 Tax=Bacillus sp. MUM 13 TaxID=1678001 RepID=UPI0008F5B7E0|nr:S-methyl-5-thioribose kinase [Bacillus sp. MUM 13]OIK09502.1 S-methyl-5-thioribose kinase [Bacillus sp. MUM 13]